MFACQLLAISALLAGAPEDGSTEDHDAFAGARRVAAYSFEANEDRDYDDLPDDWTRRRGPGFPHFVKVEIDRGLGRTGRASLRFDVDGGEAALYSPQIEVDSLHAFLFEGFVRTQLLQHDAAIVTVSLLDHERHRVQRFQSRPVTGTHGDWVRVRIGPMPARPEVRFAVIACHLVHEDGAGSGLSRDFHGAVWFDDLVLSRTPRLTLKANFLEQFVDPNAGIVVTAQLGGIDPGDTHRLVFELRDVRDEVVATTERAIHTPGEDEAAGAVRSRERRDGERDVERPIVVEWTLPPPENGFYRARAVLFRGDDPLLAETATLTVMDLLPATQRGEFGWAIPAEATSRLDTDRFANVVTQAGVNWLKQPVWRMATDGDVRDVLRAVKLYDTLQRRNVRIVGVLADPPAELRRQFAEEWTGTSEAFTMPPEFWSRSLEPVLARFSSHVSHWQLGGDDDSSFVGLERLDATLAAVKQEFDRIGRDSRIGVRWTWDAELPALAGAPGSFLSILERERLAPESLAEKLERSHSTGVQRWAVLEPIGRSKAPLEERAIDLVKRMTLVKVAGADAIFAYDVFDPEFGLLNADGSPTPMLLPWRTLATTLAGAEYLGQLQLPGGSTNHVFARDGEALLVMWNDTPDEGGGADAGVPEPIVEEFYFGDEAYTLDPWGRATPVPLDSATGRQRFVVGRVPVVVRGGSERVARWRMAIRFRTAAFDSATGQQPEAILGRNTFSQGVTGKATLVIDREWQAEPAEWEFQVAAGEPLTLETLLELPQNATLGPEPAAIDFEITADRAYRFRVYRELRIGTGDITLQVFDRKLPDGRLEIEQVLVNATTPVEVLDLDCSLFVPGRKRQRRYVTKLGTGEDHRLYYLPDADTLRGQQLWLRAKQENGRRVLNYKWTVGENWEEAAAAGQTGN